MLFKYLALQLWLKGASHQPGEFLARISQREFRSENFMARISWREFCDENFEMRILIFPLLQLKKCIISKQLLHQRLHRPFSSFHFVWFENIYKKCLRYSRCQNWPVSINEISKLLMKNLKSLNIEMVEFKNTDAFAYHWCNEGKMTFERNIWFYLMWEWLMNIGLELDK